MTVAQRAWRDAATARRRLQAYLGEGRTRMAHAAAPIVLAALAAAVSFWIARTLLGQPFPFFAPAATWISLGFSRDRNVRRVAEMAIGVSVGVALGEVLGLALGVGAWQVGLAMAVAALLARLLDRGVLMTTQAGLQAIIVVALPAGITGGSFGRWTDALVGGAVALVVAVVVPGRSWRRSHALAEAALSEIAGTLAMLATALRRGDVRRAADALAVGRASEPILASWRAAGASGMDAVRFSPVARRHRAEILELVQACTFADRAMRNVRVVTRRALTTIEAQHELHDPRALPELGDLVGRIAVRVGRLGAELNDGVDLADARADFLALGEEAQPDRYPGWRVQSLVVLLRSVLVDMLQITGMPYDEAKAFFTRPA